MFLSKRRGIYYLWFVADDGIRHKVSTRTTNKNEALKFVQGFKQQTVDRRSGRIPISQFSSEFVAYCSVSEPTGQMMAGN